MSFHHIRDNHLPQTRAESIIPEPDEFRFPKGVLVKEMIQSEEEIVGRKRKNTINRAPANQDQLSRIGDYVKKHLMSKNKRDAPEQMGGFKLRSKWVAEF
jgi:hypothetical protein